jgi:hypothetical protein
MLDTSPLLVAWLRVTAESYPAETARHLLEDQDPFRNPVGQVLRDTLPALLTVILGNKPAAYAFPALERLIRIRAVQEFTPAQAIGFLFQVKPLIRENFPNDAAIEDRITELTLSAFDMYVNCREQMHAIQLKELRRKGAAC